MIDGEIAALDELGKPSFNALQNYGTGGAPLHFYAFDVLIFAGRDLMSKPLTERRQILEKRILPKLSEPIRCSPQLKANVADLVHSVKAQGLEGLVATRHQRVFPTRKAPPPLVASFNDFGGESEKRLSFSGFVFHQYGESIERFRKQCCDHASCQDSRAGSGFLSLASAPEPRGNNYTIPRYSIMNIRWRTSATTAARSYWLGYAAFADRSRELSEPSKKVPTAMQSCSKPLPPGERWAV